MSYDYSENILVQESAGNLLRDELGWDVRFAYNTEVLGKNGTFGRESYHEILLLRYFRVALKKLNPWINDNQISEAQKALENRLSTSSLLQVNEEKYFLIRDGIPVTVKKPNGQTETRKAMVIDFQNPDNNYFLAVKELKIHGDLYRRRTDIVGFVNGIPLLFVELKKNTVDVQNAYDDNYTDYQDTIPHLFYYNAFLMLSNGTEAKVGTLGSKYEFFHEWKRLAEDDQGSVALETMLRGICKKENFLDLFENFILFDHSGGRTAKILARNHQYLGVNEAMKAYSARKLNDGKLGVFWHTQGSGKSYSMVFFAQKIRRKFEGSPTFVILTDREELNSQISDTFENCGLLGKNKSSQFIAASGENLVQKLKGNPSFIFTLIQKFNKPNLEPIYPDHDIIIMSDEAHRSQYGIFADNMMKLLPTAARIGFTGTPISAKDRNTREVFGDYIDIYDMTQAVEDGATRPVYYESRVVHLKLDNNTLALIDSTYDILEQRSDSATIEKSKKMLGQMESVLGADSTIHSLCKDIVEHYEKYRANLLTGKAMIVAYSRPIAMKIYHELLELRPGWKDKVGVVMTGSNNDPEEWKAIIGTKAYKETLARKFKDNEDPMKIAIVVDMWLTGFDVPSLATMYVYKPMHGYNLMQAIARVNRVFKDKEGGLIVDYVGIASALKAAMKEYTKRDQSKYGDMNIAKVAYPKFKEKLQVCKDLLHGFDFSGFFDGSPLTMAKVITGGVNFVLDSGKPDRKDLFLKEALLLKQSHSLCSSMTTEQERHEAAYMEAVRSMVIKITYGGAGGKTLSLKEINAQINELLKASIQSEGVISLFDSKAAGENFSLFDPAVIDEISRMKEKNIAVEILKKLMSEQVHLYKRTNVVQSEKFSEKIARLMNTYYNGLITNEEVIRELLKTAQEIRELYQTGKKLGLTQEELAFYDALTKPENVKDFYQNDELIALTRELTEMLRKNRTIDWQKKETARAQMRKMVKRLLKKYKYPPEDYSEAISTVISQCELWTDNYDTVEHAEETKRTVIYQINPQPISMAAESAAPYGNKK